LSKTKGNTVLYLGKEVPFSMVSNHIAYNERVSYKAKGLYLVMVSKATLAGWRFNKMFLVSQSTDGLRALESGLKELKDAGYLEIKPVKENNRFSGWEWIIYPTPCNTKLHGVTQVPEIHVLGITQNKHLKRSNIDSNNTNTKNIVGKYPYKVIIEDLNKQAKTKYRNTSGATQELIKARINEGYTVEDFKKVHSNKCAGWLDSEMAKFLRPSTLYMRKHFDEYLNEVVSKKDLPAPKCIDCDSILTYRNYKGRVYCRDCYPYEKAEQI
jgi:uncharacterized phage protein (TIGR02220 family)